VSASRCGRRRIEIARGEKAEGGPYAYVIDLAAQHDPTRTVEFLRTLRRGGVEIRRADAPFTVGSGSGAGGASHPAGAYVIGPQPFRPYVIDLMEPKTFPERRLHPGGPPDPPYDMTGYELRLQMGVRADAVTTPFPLPATVVEVIAPAPGGVRGDGTAAFAVSPNQNLGVRAINRLLKGGAAVSLAPDNSLVVRNVTRDAAEREGRELGVVLQALDAAPPGSRPLRAPRIGLYRSHLANMDEGWTRWLLEQYEFSFRNLSNADIRTGDLSACDVLLFADEAADRILNGHADGTMPAAYVGGIGVDGAANVRRFVERGGWLVAWDRAADFAILTLGLPLRNTVRDTRPEEFFIPGSLVRIVTKPDLPLAAGMARDAIAMFSDSQAFAVIPPAAEGRQRASRDVEVVVEYARDKFLASGWQLGGERYLAGRAAAVRVPVGKGQAVVFGFRPHWRGQPHNTFKLLFNALWLSTLEGPPPSPPRPTAP
jgi:hypothetical protein